MKENVKSIHNNGINYHTLSHKVTKNILIYNYENKPDELIQGLVNIIILYHCVVSIIIGGGNGDPISRRTKEKYRGVIYEITVKLTAWNPRVVCIA